MQHHATLEGAIFGGGTAITAKAMLLFEQQHLSWGELANTFILGVVGAIGGVIATAVVKWIKNKIKDVDLKARWHAEETKIGSFVKNWIGKVLIVCSILSGANEYLLLVPADYVPMWVKTMVVITGLIAFTGGKLTKKDVSKVQEGEGQASK